MNVGQIEKWLDSIAPFDTAESFDNVGLLMGDRNTEVHTIVFGMDLTEALTDEALRLNAELIITHHPFIFHAIKRIDYTLPQNRTLCRLAAKGTAVLAAHTNWDQACGGISDSLAIALELLDVQNADSYVRVGTLPSPISAANLKELLHQQLGANVRCYPAADKLFSRIAVAGGAYGEGYEAALAAGADAYVVGEIAHHEILDACARGLTVCDAGHFATEWPGVKALHQRFLADAAAGCWSIQSHLHDKAPYAGAHLAL